MTKALLDTNVLLDALTGREPFRENAERIFMLAAAEKIEGWITASSVTDIYYLIRRTLSEAAARESLRHLFDIFAVIPVHGSDCESAMELAMGDFEDALAVVCGYKADLDCIITRDKAFLQAKTLLPVFSSDAFLQKFSSA